MPVLKHYFNVSNSYVLSKLFIVLFPFRHRPWSRKQQLSHSGQDGFYLAPREDINSPDMYIPLMALVTYILLSTILAGLRGAFQPELLGGTLVAAGAVVAAEILGLKFGSYLLSISSESQLLDLVAYSGYKFVGTNVTLVVSEIFNAGRGTGGYVGWTVFLYTFFANAFFLVSVQPASFSPFSLSAGAWLTRLAAPVTEIRSPTGPLFGANISGSGRGGFVHSRAAPAEQADAVPLLLQLRRPVRLYVDSEPAGFVSRSRVAGRRRGGKGGGEGSGWIGGSKGRTNLDVCKSICIIPQHVHSSSV